MPKKVLLTLLSLIGSVIASLIVTVILYIVFKSHVQGATSGYLFLSLAVIIFIKLSYSIWKNLWIICFIIFFPLILSSLIDELLHVASLRPFDVIADVFIALSTVGLFAYSFNKKILSEIFWKIFFFINLLYIFYELFIRLIPQSILPLPPNMVGYNMTLNLNHPDFGPIILLLIIETPIMYALSQLASGHYRVQIPNPPPVPDPAPKYNWIVLGSSILFLIVLGSIAFQYSQNQNLKNILGKYPQIQTSQTPTPMPIVTLNLLQSNSSNSAHPNVETGTFPLRIGDFTFNMPNKDYYNSIGEEDMQTGGKFIEKPLEIYKYENYLNCENQTDYSKGIYIKGFERVSVDLKIPGKTHENTMQVNELRITYWNDTNLITPNQESKDYIASSEANLSNFARFSNPDLLYNKFSSPTHDPYDKSDETTFNDPLDIVSCTGGPSPYPIYIKRINNPNYDFVYYMEYVDYGEGSEIGDSLPVLKLFLHKNHDWLIITKSSKYFVNRLLDTSCVPPPSDNYSDAYIQAANSRAYICFVQKWRNDYRNDTVIEQWINDMMSIFKLNSI